MALIKNMAPEALARDAVVLDLGDLKLQGERMRQDAQRRADQIIADAKHERERLLKGAAEEGRIAGHKEGFEKGLVEGVEQAKAEAMERSAQAMSSLQDRWMTALDAFESDRETLLLEARSDVLTLAIRIAAKVTRRLVELDSSIIRGQLEEALTLLRRQSKLVIAVHPQDMEEAREVMPALLARLSGGADAELVADDDLSPGSCIARTDVCEVDVSIETQLEIIIDTLTASADSMRRDSGAQEQDAEQSVSDVETPDS